MEDIYLKNIDHVWHSKKVDLKTYFDSFSEAYCEVMKRDNMSLCNIFQSVLGENIKMDKKDLANIIQKMSELREQLKPKLSSLETLRKGSCQQKSKRKSKSFKTRTLKKVQSQKRNKNVVCKEQKDHARGGKFKQNPGEKDGNEQERSSDDDLKELNENNAANSPLTKQSLNILKFRKREKLKQARYKKNILTTRGELLVNQGNDRSNRGNLKRGKHFVVSVRIHEPFTHREERGKVERFKQEIVILGHQTLLDLRDKIICQSDFQDIRGDVSQNPDSLVTVLSRDKYKSAMFYFDNTFYIDERGDQDYSEVIKKWARPRGIKVGITRAMGVTQVSDLQLRFGYPYVYTHQGSCEHLVIISDARLLSGRDSLDSSDYPRISRFPRPITQYCCMCLKKPVKWIVVGCERLPKNISYMCKSCLKSYNYIDGQKVGNFKAYRFFQKNILL